MEKPDQHKANLRLQAYAATFIDILGQGSALRELRNSEWWKLTPNTKRLLSETYGRVQRFRDLYRRFLNSFFKPSHLEQEFVVSNPSKGELTLWQASRVHDLRVLCIADSIIALVPIQVRDGVFPFSSVLALMGACCNTILSSFCEHRAIRGGVALGPCIFNSETEEVYGSAISVAVELEKSANWPRLLVDPEIIRVANTFAEHSSTRKADRLNATFAQRCLDLVVEDEDGQPIIDYLGPSVRQLYVIPERISGKAEEFILSQLSEHSGNKKVLDKYKKVQQYFEKHKQH